MHDADVLEAINFEQLVTATDRLLLRGGRAPKRRPSVSSLGPHGPLARGSMLNIERMVAARPAIAPYVAPAAVARSSAAPRIAPAAVARPSAASASYVAPAAVARPAAASRAQAFAITVVIPTLVGVAVGLAAML